MDRVSADFGGASSSSCGTRGQRASRGTEDARGGLDATASVDVSRGGRSGRRARGKHASSRSVPRGPQEAAFCTGRARSASPLLGTTGFARLSGEGSVARVRRRRLGTYLRGRVDAHGRVAATASRRGQAFATNGVMTWTAPACLCGLDVHVNERLPTARKARQLFGIPRATTSAEDLREGLPRRHSPQRRAHSPG